MLLQLAGAFGPRAENGNLPSAGNFTYGGAHISERFVYYVIQLSGVVMALSKGDKNAFADSLKLTMDAAFMEFRMNMNTIIHLAGTSSNLNAVVAKVSTTAASSVVVSDNNLQPNWIYPGMTLDSLTSGGTAHDSSLVVSSVSGTTVNFTAAITNTAAADYLCFAGAGGPTGTTTPDGLLNGVDDGTYETTYQNLSRTTYPVWKSYTNSNGSRTLFGNASRRTLTPNLLQTAIDGQAALAGSQRPIDVIYSDLAVRRTYWQALAPDRRYPDGMFDGGWRGLKFSNGDVELPWMASAMCNKYTVWLLHTGKNKQGSESSEGGSKNEKAGLADKVAEAELFAVYQTPEGAPDWDSANGGTLKQVYGNSGANFVDASGAYLKWYTNIATLRPNAHAVIDDVSET